MAPLVLDAVRRTQPDASARLWRHELDAGRCPRRGRCAGTNRPWRRDCGRRPLDARGAKPDRVDRISTVLFAPDERSRRTLEREQVAGQIEVVGDVMADATKRLEPIARRRSRILAELDLTPARYLAATVHRGQHAARPAAADRRGPEQPHRARHLPGPSADRGCDDPRRSPAGRGSRHDAAARLCR